MDLKQYIDALCDGMLKVGITVAALAFVLISLLHLPVLAVGTILGTIIGAAIKMGHDWLKLNKDRSDT